MIRSDFSIIHNNSDIYYLDTPEDDNNLPPFIYVFGLCKREINSILYHYYNNILYEMNKIYLLAAAKFRFQYKSTLELLQIKLTH